MYFNLTRKVFSLMDLSSGLVYAHGNDFSLAEGTFVVSEAGRNRVLTTKVRNVHAFVVGTLLEKSNVAAIDEISYNPYRAHYFYTRSNFAPINEAKLLTFTNNKVYLNEL